MLVEGLLDEGDAAAVHWLAVGQEALLQRSGHAREALQQREQVLVLVLKEVVGWLVNFEKNMLLMLRKTCSVTGVSPCCRQI